MNKAAYKRAWHDYRCARYQAAKHPGQVVGTGLRQRNNMLPKVYQDHFFEAVHWMQDIWLDGFVVISRLYLPVLPYYHIERVYLLRQKGIENVD